MASKVAGAYACCEHCEDCDPSELHLWHADPCPNEDCIGAVNALSGGEAVGDA